eukprot:gene9378-11041_t
MTASINQTNFDAGLLIGKSGELPVSTSFSSCDITSMKVHITFSSDALDYLTPRLEELIKKAFNVLLCTKVPEFLENNVTSALVNKVDPMLEYIISSQPSPLPIYNSHYTSWGNSLVSKVKNIVERLEGVADLKDFILCFLKKTDMQALKKTMLTEVQNLFFTPPCTVDLTTRHLSSVVAPDQEIPLEEEEPSSAAGSANLDISEDTVIWHKADFPASYNSSLTLTSFKIRGLDSLTELELLEPVPGFNTTMRSAVGFGELTITLGLQVDIVPIDAAVSSPKQKLDALGARSAYSEKLQVTLAMEDVSLMMDLVLAVNSFVLKSYYLDQLGTRSCWLSAIEELSIANLQVHTEITTLKAVQVLGSAGALEADILALVNNAIALVISPTGFGQLTTDLIAGVLQGPLRTKFNANAAAHLAKAKKDAPCLTHYPYDDQSDFIVWAESSLIRTVDYVVNDLLGYQGVNKLMTCATNGTGQLALNTSKLAVSLGGLNSFYALRVLAPVVSTIQDAVAPYELENLISLGYCPFVGSPLCNPFELLVNFNPKAVKASANKLTTAFVQAASAFNLAMKLSNFSVYLNTELKLDKDGLRDTQYKQLDTLGCVGQSFQAIAVEKASLSVADAEIYLNGVQSRNITRFMSKVLSALTRQDKLDKRNSDMAYKLSVAGETCKNNGVAPHVTPTDDSSSGSGDNLNWQWELFILVVGCLSALIMLMAAYHYWGSYGKHYCSSDFLEVKTEEEEGMPLLTRLYHRWDCKNSLLFHHQIPLWIRIAVPVCVLGDVALFLQSNIDPAAVSVMAKIVTDAKTIDVGSVFDFGLGSTVADMWEAGVYPLAVLILFFSGAWPYVKLLSMLTTWLAPPAILSIERRESVLTVLDVLGKWSLIDFFVMILMLCAFFFNIYLGDKAIIEVTVLPRWGFYSFLLATMVSLGLGHIILACHRLIIEPKVLPIPDDYCPRESLSSIVYEMSLTDRDVAMYAQQDDKNIMVEENSNTESLLGPAVTEEGDSEFLTNNNNNDYNNYNPNDRLTPVPTARPDPALHAATGTTMLIKVTTAGKVAVVLALVITAFVVIAGTFVETMRFEFKGLVGLILKDAADVDYSFVTVGTSIPEHSGVPNDFATRWLQASLFLFGQAMPFAVLLAMLGLWLVPLTLASQRSIFVLAEVLNAWSALDVFCIAIAAALLEIQQFAAFIVGDSCDGINVILEEHMDEILEGDDKCFDVIATLTSNSWLLFLAAVLLIIVVLPLLQVCHNAIHLRLKLSAQASLLLHHLTRGTDKQAETLREALRSASKDGLETRLSKEKLYGEDAMLVRNFVHGNNNSETTNELVIKLLPERESESNLHSGPGSHVATPFHSLSNNTFTHSNTNTDSSGASTQPPAATSTTSTSASEDRTSTTSNPLNSSNRGSARSSASHSPSNASEQGSESDSAEPTFWQRCTMHNFNMSLLQNLAAMKLVELSYTPTVVVEDSLVLSTTNSYALHAE